MNTATLFLIFSTFSTFLTPPSQVLEEARLMQYPDIYGERIVFTYGGNLWLVPDEGGVARQITTSPGLEWTAKFSPDGKWIAFTGQYEGNSDVYIIPSQGGEPKRLTMHPDTDQVVEWTPDGQSIIFISPRESKNGRYREAFTISIKGGTPEVIPMGESGLLSPSPDGKAFAYNRISTEFATWKRYRGGLQSWISFYEPSTNRYWELPHEKGDRSAYLWPMWVDHRVYYVNDSDGIRNLYVYDTKAQRKKQLTHFTEYDISWPSYGSGKIVFVREGKLWTLDIETEKIREVKVRILTDLPETRPRRVSLAGNVRDVTISPSAVRVAVEARGELFSVPVKEGVTKNFSNTTGARERFPRWSPDGKWILFASDKTGEYEFYIQKSDLSEEPIRITQGSNRFLNPPVWSPDSKKFFYTDSSNRGYIVDIETKEKKTIGKPEYPAYGDAVWSPDSKWLAYSRSESTGFSRIYIYDVEKGQETLISEGMFDDTNPVFDATGKYLFFVSRRNIGFASDVFELSPIATNTDMILGWTLKKETPSPFAPKDEGEKIEEKAKEGEGQKPTEQKPEQKPEQKQPGKPEPPKVEIETQGIHERVFVVPIPPGSYQLVAAPKGKILYTSAPTFGMQGGSPTLFSFDLESKQSAPILSGFSALAFTPNYDKMAYLSGSAVGVVPVAPNQKTTDGRVRTDDVEARIDPRAEWKHGYWEAWRYVRDYFWADNIAGLDWQAIGERYAKWLPHVAHRTDLDQLLWEMLGDLGTGHAYLLRTGFGARPGPQVGLLGADFENTAQGLRFKKIYRGHPWDSNRRAPLGEPGLNVKEGDFLLAVDGIKLGPNTSLDDLLEGKANKLVELTINSTPSEEGSRKILVRPIADDVELRYADWIDSRRKYVEEKSNGRIAYVHVPDTAFGGIVEFWRMFYPQVDKDAMIIDERYNGGGFIPDFFIEKLSRKLLTYWKPRDLGSFRSPSAAMLGPKVMLINAYAGSGGDAFPYFFKKRNIGPLIGTRTWGGLIGIMGVRDLMCGGGITVPQFAMWDLDEKGRPRWVVENIGVEPDIEVDNRPDLVAQGKDPQLDAAIEYLLNELKKNPPRKPKEPPFPGVIDK
ncbi:MAG TPA: PDZ domain-containing protein [Fimbriimonadales bacterium]|nr:PDZ domain-containing protein [Fimbriimonadales bacterium]